MKNLVICVIALSAFVVFKVILVLTCLTLNSSAADAGYASAVNCTAVADGVYELGCKSFARCTGGQVTIVSCEHDTVYNNKTSMCDDPKNVAPPCGVMIDCTNVADGRYADKDQNCRTWYTCQDHKFLGHNFCPTGTVFDEKLSTCNWENAVPPPCGTMTK